MISHSVDYTRNEILSRSASLAHRASIQSVATYSAGGAAGKIKNDMAADNTDSSDDDSMRSAVTAIAV